MIIIDKDLCDLCGTCVAVCPEDCIELTETYLQIDNVHCTTCGLCTKVCPVSALLDSEKIDEKSI